MKKLPRIYKPLIAACTAMATMLAAPAVSAQTDYPNKPVSLVVPFAPGGSTDIFGRLIAQHYFKDKGANAIVENVPGAGGNIGAARVARAAPDGHTLEIGAKSIIHPAVSAHIIT